MNGMAMASPATVALKSLAMMAVMMLPSFAPGVARRHRHVRGHRAVVFGLSCIVHAGMMLLGGMMGWPMWLVMAGVMIYAASPSSTRTGSTIAFMPRNWRRRCS